MPLQPPRIPSHDEYVDYMANHHAHLGNNTRLPNITGTHGLNFTNSTGLNVIHPGELNVTSVANLTVAAVVNAVTTYDKGNNGLVIASGVILGVFFSFFIVIIGLDMRAKYRTGELRDDMRGAKNMLILLLKLIPALFVALSSKIMSLFHRKQAQPSEADVEAAAQKTRESQAIVERLAGKSSSPGTETALSVASFGSNFENSK